MLCVMYEVLIPPGFSVLTVECRVPCKATTDELESLCRSEGVTCKELGVSKTNLTEYEVEYLCNYKRVVPVGKLKDGTTPPPQVNYFFHLTICHK